jgi:hypothetical protein
MKIDTVATIWRSANLRRNPGGLLDAMVCGFLFAFLGVIIEALNTTLDLKPNFGFGKSYSRTINSAR